MDFSFTLSRKHPVSPAINSHSVPGLQPPLSS